MTLVPYWLKDANPSFMDAYDWDWWARYGAEVQEELEQLVLSFMVREWPDMPKSEAQTLAAKFAEQRAGELLRIDGPANLATLTRERVGKLVSEAIEGGKSLSELRKLLEDDLAFSPKRAEMVARTETAIAHGQGAKEAAHLQGRNEKHWVTQSDDHVDEDCRENETAGWIPSDDAFPSGHDTIPAHPDCRCNVRYRTAPVSGIDPLEGIDEDIAEAIAQSRGAKTGIILEARCPVDNALLAKNINPGAEIKCPKCKQLRTFGDLPVVRVRRTLVRDEAGVAIGSVEERY